MLLALQALVWQPRAGCVANFGARAAVASTGASVLYSVACACLATAGFSSEVIAMYRRTPACASPYPSTDPAVPGPTHHRGSTRTAAQALPRAARGAAVCRHGGQPDTQLPGRCALVGVLGKAYACGALWIALRPAAAESALCVACHASKQRLSHRMRSRPAHLSTCRPRLQAWRPLASWVQMPGMAGCATRPRRARRQEPTGPSRPGRMRCPCSPFWSRPSGGLAADGTVLVMQAGQQSLWKGAELFSCRQLHRPVHRPAPPASVLLAG